MAKDLDFLYASARIKVLETKLLGRTAIERILDADGPEETLKLLGDTDYGNDIAEMENIYDFEKVLVNSMARTIRTLKESFEEHEIIRFFTVKNDYHNLKVIVKGSILGIEVKEYFSPLGEVSPEEMLKYAEGDNTASIPDSLKEAFTKAMEAYESSQDPQQVDLVLDRALFKEMAAIVDKLKDDFLKEYFIAMVDLTNIKTMVRLKKMDAEGKTLENALLPGGSIEVEFFKEYFTRTSSDLIDALSYTPYQGVVEAGLNWWEENGGPSGFEKLIDNYLIGLARKGLYKSFGSETVIGYLAARENEMKILRIIMVGKINNISTDMVRERLRDVYV